MRLNWCLVLPALLASCGPPNRGNNQQATPDDAKAGATTQLSGADLLRVCKGGVAFRNGRPVEGIDARMTERQMVRLSYTRDDGKRFSYDCLVEGNVLRFRMIDEAGPGTGPGAWSGRGSRTTFMMAPGEVEFTDAFTDGSSDTQRVKN